MGRCVGIGITFLERRGVSVLAFTVSVAPLVLAIPWIGVTDGSSQLIGFDAGNDAVLELAAP
jgi:hypothetical protein